MLVSIGMEDYYEEDNYMDRSYCIWNPGAGRSVPALDLWWTRLYDETVRGNDGPWVWLHAPNGLGGNGPGMAIWACLPCAAGTGDRQPDKVPFNTQT